MEIEFKTRQFYTTIFDTEEFSVLRDAVDMLVMDYDHLETASLQTSQEKLERIQEMFQEMGSDYQEHTHGPFPVMSFRKRNKLKSYRDQVMAFPVYGDAYRNEYYVEDLLDVNSLVFIINEILTGESDLTEAGQGFLFFYYGCMELAKILKAHPDFTWTYTEEELEEVLRSLEPYEISSFLAQVGESDANGDLS